MLQAGRGLRDVSTGDLRHLLRAIHRGELECPVRALGLAKSGLLRLQDDLDHLRNLGQDGTVAVLVAVLAERD